MRIKIFVVFTSNDFAFFRSIVKLWRRISILSTSDINSSMGILSRRKQKNITNFVSSQRATFPPSKSSIEFDDEDESSLCQMFDLVQSGESSELLKLSFPEWLVWEPGSLFHIVSQISRSNRRRAKKSFGVISVAGSQPTLARLTCGFPGIYTCLKYIRIQNSDLKAHFLDAIASLSSYPCPSVGYGRFQSWNKFWEGLE